MRAGGGGGSGGSVALKGCQAACPSSWREGGPSAPIWCPVVLGSLLKRSVRRGHMLSLVQGGRGSGTLRTWARASVWEACRGAGRWHGEGTPPAARALLREGCRRVPGAPESRPGPWTWRGAPGRRGHADKANPSCAPSWLAGARPLAALRAESGGATPLREEKPRRNLALGWGGVWRGPGVPSTTPRPGSHQLGHMHTQDVGDTDVKEGLVFKTLPAMRGPPVGDRDEGLRGAGGGLHGGGSI